MTDLTPALICRAGAALFGPEWQAPMAALVGVDERSVRRVAQAARMGRPYAVKGDWRTPLADALRKAPLDFELRAREAAEVAKLFEPDAE